MALSSIYQRAGGSPTPGPWEPNFPGGNKPPGINPADQLNPSGGRPPGTSPGGRPMGPPGTRDTGGRTLTGSQLRARRRGQAWNPAPAGGGFQFMPQYAHTGRSGVFGMPQMPPPMDGGGGPTIPIPDSGGGLPGGQVTLPPPGGPGGEVTLPPPPGAGGEVVTADHPIMGGPQPGSAPMPIDPALLSYLWLLFGGGPGGPAPGGGGPGLPGGTVTL